MLGLTWLHLSDWHQRGSDFDRQVVRDALIEDLRERAEIDPKLRRVDFVVFSGDLAFSGDRSEYQAARQYLLDPVLEVVGLKPQDGRKADRLFLVPGNHDLSRKHIYEMLPPELQKPMDSDALVKEWLTARQKRRRVLEPFGAYRKFVTGYTGQPTPDYASICQWNLKGRKVALLGLNSAWMCSRNRILEDEFNDYGYTLVGEHQIHDALEKIAGADLRIAVLHHPFEWLAEFDRYGIVSQLRRKLHFILCGHEHCPQVEVRRGTFGNCVIIPAGTCYKDRIAENPLYTNAYNLVHLDLDTGWGVVYLRRWNNSKGKWLEDRDSYASGKYKFHFKKTTKEE